MAVCPLTEYLYEKGMKKPVTIADGSALVTGLLLAMNMPVQAPLWMPVIGGVFAILVVKQLFGGLGQNIMNPALAGRCFLLISFTSRMTDFSTADGVSSATPLAVLKSGGSVDLLDAFLGMKTGCIGEVSCVAILIGAAYLLIKKVISIRIPAFYIGSAALFIFVFAWAKGGSVPDWQFILGELLTGGLMAGAFFMATDYTTSPITKGGQIIYAVLMGFLTAVFRILGSSAEGVSYAIVISNLAVPLIEKISVPKPFGVRKKEEV